MRLGPAAAVLAVLVLAVTWPAAPTWAAGIVAAGAGAAWLLALRGRPRMALAALGAAALGTLVLPGGLASPRAWALAAALLALTEAALARRGADPDRAWAPTALLAAGAAAVGVLAYAWRPARAALLAPDSAWGAILLLAAAGTAMLVVLVTPAGRPTPAAQADAR